MLNTVYRLNQDVFFPHLVILQVSHSIWARNEVASRLLCNSEVRRVILKFPNYMDCVRALNFAGISETVHYGFPFTSERRIQVALGEFIFLCLSFLLLSYHLPKTCGGQDSADGLACGRRKNWPAVPSFSFAWAWECCFKWKLVFVSVQSCLHVTQEVEVVDLKWLNSLHWLQTLTPHQNVNFYHQPQKSFPTSPTMLPHPTLLFDKH